MKSNIEISQSTGMAPIWEIAEKYGIRRDEVELFGDYKAKVKLRILERLNDRPNGKYIDITAVTPTPLGEGKTVTTIGLSLGLNRMGSRAVACLRQPSMGPVFGIKGGATGGGCSQVVPMEEINLHLTGDTHAVGQANNLLAAAADNSMLLGNPLNIDPRNVAIRRVMDINDRALRSIVVGLGDKDNGIERETGFDITAASEVMAILGLATSVDDMRQRLGRIVAAYTQEGRPVTAEDLKVAGAMAAVMKDALKPNILQTTENTLAFVHAGPFGNIAHGNSSILADRIALKLADYVVTESGFGADIGMEKFINIKCRYSGLKPDAMGVVATVRAMKMHSGKYDVKAGKPLDEKLFAENPEDVEAGCENLKAHLRIVKRHGLNAVVIINRFVTDKPSEIGVIKKIAGESGAIAAVESRCWAEGGKGSVEMAEAFVAACKKKSNFRFLYTLDMPIRQKIETIAREVYSAAGVEFGPEAEEKMNRFTGLGYGNLPICMAKTQFSISHDPKLKGAPSGFILPVRDIRASVGAGFLYPLCGTMRTMPGMPSHPAYMRIDVDKDGRVTGLS
jgi:formate--tetrahydrofolate ligase